MKATIATIVGSLVATRAFVIPSILSRAGTSGARRLLTCSAAASPGPQSRVAFVKSAGLATAVALAVGAPTAAVFAQDTDEAKVGDEVTTDTGLKYIVTAVGKGAKPNPGNTIKAHYTGWLNGFDQDGIKFDSSRDRGRPFSFKVGTGMVIKAWDEALLGMKVGERRQIIVPPELGYGKRGAGGIIPPDSTLYFDVELLAIQP